MGWGNTLTDLCTTTHFWLTTATDVYTTTQFWLLRRACHAGIVWGNTLTDLCTTTRFCTHLLISIPQHAFGVE